MIANIYTLCQYVPYIVEMSRVAQASISILFAFCASNLKQKAKHPWLYNPQITLISSQGKEHVKSLESE